MALRALALTALLFSLCGCVTTKSGMYRVFQEDVSSLMGTQYEEAFIQYGCPIKHPLSSELDLSKCEKINHGFLSPRGGAEIQKLDNGNVLHLYADYWLHKGMESRGKCSVFIELNEASNVIVNAWSKGDGCYSAY